MRVNNQRFLKFTQFSMQGGFKGIAVLRPVLFCHLRSLMTIGSMSCEKVMPSQGDNNRITWWTTGQDLLSITDPRRYSQHC